MTQALACPTLVHPPDTDLTRCQIGMSPRYLLQHLGGFVVTHNRLDEQGEVVEVLLPVPIALEAKE